MLKKLKCTLAASFIILICGCGDGGSNNSTINGNNTNVYGALLQAGSTSMVSARLKSDQTQFLVVGHYRFIFNPNTGAITGTEAGPVKVFHLNSDATIVVATTEILGSEVLTFTNVPLVADFG